MNVAAQPIASVTSQSTAATAALAEALAQALKHIKGLDAVEERVRSKLGSDAELLREIPSYLLTLGGKRVRPVLTLLAYEACGGALGDAARADKVVDVAAGIELIHMATLLHDDIIDNSPMRRRKISPFKKYGLGNTLLAGDFLLVRAFSLCARLDRQIIDWTEQACVELTEGEILETPLNTTSHTVETSLVVAQKKTASLFRLAAQSGAYLASDDLETAALMATFAEGLGVGFQIVDDILDVTADEDLLGKRSGTDLRERKPSMINVLWILSKAKLAEELQRAPAGDEEQFVAAALQELRQSSVVADAKALATKHINQASRALSAVERRVTNGSETAFGALRVLLDFALERTH